MPGKTLPDNHMASGGVMDICQRPLRDLRISVMDKCNFRCPYCMPRENFPEDFGFLAPEERLDFDEITRIVRASVRLGVRKIRLTGGEPLLRRNLADLVAELRRIKGIEDIALTTNGFLLARQADSLRRAGLDRVTVSLDALDEEIFAQMSGGYGSARIVLEAIQAVRQLGFPKGVKVNCVVRRGLNESQVPALAAYFRHSDVVLRFIEYMDVGTRNGWKSGDIVPARDIHAMIEEIAPLMPVMPHYKGEVARRYRYRDGSGEIGIIASVSAPFCGACSRARLSSDGRFYTCLFATQGVDLRPVLRSSAGQDEAGLEACLRHIWQKRDDRYSEDRILIKCSDNRQTSTRQKCAGQDGTGRIEMNYIGG